MPKFLGKSQTHIPLLGVNALASPTLPPPLLRQEMLSSTLLSPRDPQNIPLKGFGVGVFFAAVVVFFLFLTLGGMFISKISETSGAACASNSFSKRIMSQE